MSVTINEQYVRDHFRLFCEHNGPAFFKRVSPMVHWHVMGSIPTLSAEYRSLNEFQTKAFNRVGARLDGRMTLTLTNCIVSGQQAVIEMAVDADSCKQKNGQPLPNTHCWVVHYDDSGVIDRIRMYMDGVLMAQLMTNNPDQ